MCISWSPTDTRQAQIWLQGSTQFVAACFHRSPGVQRTFIMQHYCHYRGSSDDINWKKWEIWTVGFLMKQYLYLVWFVGWLWSLEFNATFLSGQLLLKDIWQCIFANYIFIWAWFNMRCEFKVSFRQKFYITHHPHTHPRRYWNDHIALNSYCCIGGCAPETPDKFQNDCKYNHRTRAFETLRDLAIRHISNINLPCLSAKQPNANGTSKFDPRLIRLILMW